MSGPTNDPLEKVVQPCTTRLFRTNGRYGIEGRVCPEDEDTRLDVWPKDEVGLPVLPAIKAVRGHDRDDSLAAIRR